MILGVGKKVKVISNRTKAFFWYFKNVISHMTLVNKLSHWTATSHADTAAGAKGITVNKELVLVEFNVSE